MITDSLRPPEMDELVHEANGGLHNASLALQLLAEVSPERSTAGNHKALINAGMQGLCTARDALIKLGTMLAQQSSSLQHSVKPSDFPAHFSDSSSPARLRQLLSLTTASFMPAMCDRSPCYDPLRRWDAG